ncbi:MAG TPA: ATP-binding cassette domain-containing protein [Jatrophihabitans sp.]|jgi:putative ABC transport system ATP-binding protein|uniref:ATP-binding cassette domain-containing protein n=1 Tax=Jatrophihabitans sp. TaxID=1932789 RepID=UPI002F1CDA6B
MTAPSAGGLRGSGIEVRFGALVAVRQVDLVLGPGELVAVTGPSGAGKSSLLAALSGLIQPTGGTLSLDGQLITGRDQAAGRGIVLIPQGNALIRILTALENVAVPLVAARVADARQRAEAALVALGLDEAADQLLEELSGGQQQRVAVARGLAERPSYLLADEPTSELDALNRTRVMALLRGEARRGAGVLVATHDPEAAALCDAELRLDEGLAGWVRDDRPTFGVTV